MHDYWARCLFENWGIQATLTALHGEYDLNFKAETASGERYLLKVMRPGCDPDFVSMQCLAIQHVHRHSDVSNVPEIVLSSSQQDFVISPDDNGVDRILWVNRFIEGTVYAHFNPKCNQLIDNLGRSIAQLHHSLSGFEHKWLQRSFKWNLLESSWIGDHFSAVTDVHRQEILENILSNFNTILPALKALPSTPIHNDINDHNLLASRTLTSDSVISGIVDFGDMCAAPRVCEIAIAGAYIVMDHPHPERALQWLVAPIMTSRR